jgi:transcriptional regulator with XRE-family HTH domain
MRPSSATIGRRLAAIRVNRGLTQGELAVLIGKSKTSICCWEHGRSEMRVGDAIGCARALRCRLRDLLAPVEAPIPPCSSVWLKIKRQLEHRIDGATGNPRPHRRARIKQRFTSGL